MERPLHLSSSSINASCPALIFVLAVAKSNHSARSISGNSCWRPEWGGHSMVNVLLLMAVGSQSPSKAQAWTILPPFCLMGLQRNERASWLQARLLLEFPLGGDEQILVAIRFALGDRP